MIKLPIDIKLKMDADIVSYNLLIEELKEKSIIAKNILLTENWEPFQGNNSKDDKIIFILQFTDFILDLVLFPDEEVIDKLNQLGFANHSLKWFVKLDDILREIERLSGIDGLFFFPYSFLFAVQSHLQTKFFITLIEDFELNETYNNADTNIIYKDLAERFRRREYNEKKKQTPKMDFFEKIMNNLYNRIERDTGNDKLLTKQIMLQPLKGNTSIFYSILNSFYSEGISRNKVYNELFPVLKMIMKDHEFLSEEEFGTKNKDFNYEADYSKYKIARTKKLLQKK